MKIGIIGTGNMAAGFARRLALSGTPFVLGGRDQGKARALTETLGGNSRVAPISEVVHESELLVPALPYQELLAALPTLGDLTGKTLLDITNPITGDFAALTIGFTSSAAEEIQKAAVGAHIVKAFNTIFASLLDLPDEQTRDTQVFYATDHPQARELAASFIQSVGFAPVFAGPLSNSRYLEPLGELNIHFGYMLGHGTAIAPSWQSLSAKEFA